LTDAPDQTGQAGVLDQLLDTMRAHVVWRHFRAGGPVEVQLPADGRGQLVAVGSGRVIVDRGAGRNPYNVGTGESVLWSGHSGPARLRGDARAELVLATIEFGGPHRLLAAGRLPAVLWPRRAEPTAAPIVQFLVAEAGAAGPGTAVVVGRLVDTLLVLQIRTFLASGRCPGHTLAPLRDPAIAASLSLMHDFPQYSWRVEELARRVHLSRSVFADRFRELIGVAPIEYLIRWRVDRAAADLRTLQSTVEATAHRHGYASQAAFSRAFRRIMGVGPGQYRETHRHRP
jgi:AraC-like DNA-binding protein